MASGWTAFLCTAVFILGIARHVSARALSEAGITCATGAKYEVYPFDRYNHTLLNVAGKNPDQQHISTVQQCAQFCLDTPGCGCAWYEYPNADCVYRAGACSTSELFIPGSVPAPTLTYGLIQKCSVPARKPPVAVAGCAPGSAYDIYPVDDYSQSFHSIMGSAAGIETVQNCADVCLKTPGCGCAFYTEPRGSCQYRQGPCNTSSLFIPGANPAPTLTHGLVNMCPQTHAPPVAEIATWKKCAGIGFTEKPCCGRNDRCVAVNKWYSQCLPIDQKIPATWTGIITKTVC